MLFYNRSNFHRSSALIRSNGEWRMGNGKWEMENGKWKMGNG